MDSRIKADLQKIQDGGSPVVCQGQGLEPDFIDFLHRVDRGETTFKWPRKTPATNSKKKKVKGIGQEEKTILCPDCGRPFTYRFVGGRARTHCDACHKQRRADYDYARNRRLTQERQEARQSKEFPKNVLGEQRLEQESQGEEP